MTRATRFVELFVFVALGAWLAAAAWLVQLEGYDGLDAVLNARFFTGQWPLYTETRAPLLGLLLVPAELLARALGLHALDLRPHHALMALLHGGYLLAAYAWLCRVHERSFASVLAFVAAVPTFVWFSNAPFISHDLFPGALLLAMLFVAERFARDGAVRDVAALAALGALSMLVKPMFGVFWLCVIAAETTSADWRHGSPRVIVRRLAWLAAGAAASLLATLLMAGWVTASVFPDVPFALRGLRHLQFLTREASQKVLPEPVWVYVRNLPAYGPLAVAALLPGLWASVRGTAHQKRAAVALLVALGFTHLLPFGSARYLAYVGPLAAAVVAPVLARWLGSRAGRAVALALLLSGFAPLWPYDAASEAARIGLPFYRVHPARAFLAHAEDAHGRLRRPLYVNWDVLSFASERDTPFAGDLYHDLFHFGPHHLMAFYGLQPGDVRRFDTRKGPTRWPDGAAMLLCTTGNLVNSPSWTRAPALRRDSLAQVVLFAAKSELTTDAAGVHALRELGPVALRQVELAGKTSVVLEGPGARALLRGIAFPRASLASSTGSLPLRLSTQGDALLEGADVETVVHAQPPLRLRYFREVFVERPAPTAP